MLKKKTIFRTLYLFSVPKLVDLSLVYETNGKDFLRNSLTNNAVQNLIRLLFVEVCCFSVNICVIIYRMLGMVRQ